MSGAKEIVIPRQRLFGGMALVSALLFLVIGLLVSPRVEGHPVLLSPRNRALFGYLDRVAGWHGELLKEADILARAFAPQEETRGERELPLFATPAPRAESLYGRVSEVRDVLDRLDALRREVEVTTPPRGLEAMHGLAAEAVQRHVVWAEAVADYLAAPSQALADRARAAAREAEDARRGLGEMLARQRLMQEPVAAPTSERRQYIPAVQVSGE